LQNRERKVRVAAGGERKECVYSSALSLLVHGLGLSLGLSLGLGPGPTDPVLRPRPRSPSRPLALALALALALTLALALALAPRRGNALRFPRGFAGAYAFPAAPKTCVAARTRRAKPGAKRRQAQAKRRARREDYGWGWAGGGN